MENIVSIHDLSKSFGSKKALNQLNLEIKKGTVLGLLGPNGSGKTTLIKILAGLYRYKNGVVLINGEAIGPNTKSIISYLPDENFLPFSSISEAMAYYKDVFPDFNEERFQSLLSSMDLNLHNRIKGLSKGMIERLNLSFILAREAKLFILDEPIAGVDPVARDKILDAIIDRVDDETSMLITTHLVHDIDRIFDEVAFIKDGQIELHENCETLRNDRGCSIDELYKKIFS